VTRPLYLVPGSPHWPEELDSISNPPHELWVRGRLELLERVPRVAIVGSRTPTPYGADQARRFASALAESGVAVVSGMARGVDWHAHEAVLETGGATIAVLGSGVDRPWPQGPLADRLVREGLLLSEYPVGRSPRKHHFPLRNRLISGLSTCVLVIEAAQRSGSLITARWAVDQGREVFALPGRVDHPMSRGCHGLLRAGAQLAESPDDLLAELGLSVRPDPDTGQTPDHPILRALEGETLTLHELAQRLGQPGEVVLGQLVELELYDRVARSPGGLFRRA